MKHAILWLMMCGPLVLVLCIWGLLLLKQDWPNRITLIALTTGTANALLGACLCIYYSTHPSPYLPPWKDPAVLNTGLLSLSSPIVLILGLVAAAKDGRKWIVVVIELISIPLLLVGCASAVSV